jgi:ankyrin repeat protein
VRLLLEAGAKVDETNNDGETALIKAAERDDENAVRMLLKAGAAVDAADNDGQTHRTNVRCS